MILLLHKKIPKVRGSDGHITEWDRGRVVKQILEDTAMCKQYYGHPGASQEFAEEIAEKVENRLASMNIEYLSAPLVREIVCVTLLEEGAEEHRNMCARVGMSLRDAHLIDVGTGFESKDNANLQGNPETAHKKKADKLAKEQALAMMPPHLNEAHMESMIHIHDLEYFTTRYFCQDWDLRYFFYYGLIPDGNGTKASVSAPAKRAEVAILHAVKVLGSAQTNFAGGEGYYNFLTFIAPYLEGMSYKDINQLMQMFVYEMTQMTVARGGQIVFSSVQLTPGVPTLWRDKPVVYRGYVYDGKQAPLRTYGEFEREVRLAFKALMEVMLEGDYWGKPFNFPKPEISIEPDFMKENEEFNKRNPDLPTYKELYQLTFELASKFGTPYYDNQIPEYRGAGKGVSCYQCCAYQFAANPETDHAFMDKMNFKNGAHFSMGAGQVVTINCPRAAYEADGDTDILVATLKEYIDLAVEVFKLKREWMNEIIRNNRIPFATQRPRDPHTWEPGAQAVDINGLTFVVGIIGINEMVQQHMGKQLYEDKAAVKLAIYVIAELNKYAREISVREGFAVGIARTPAETTAQRFAVADLLDDRYTEKALKIVKGDIDKFKEQVGTTTDLPVYYTNGTHVPVNAPINVIERITIEQTFFPLLQGGNILHVFLGEKRPDALGLMDFAMHIAKNTQAGYFAFTRDLTIALHRYRMFKGYSGDD